MAIKIMGIKNNLIEKAIKIIQIDNDNCVVLLDFFDPFFKDNKQLASKNIFLLDRKEDIKWIVHSDLLISGGFVDILFKENNLKAVSWNTGLYKIDLGTGFATPEILLK
ncbi:hypothetical protein [Gilliamella sp. wkB112]|uniref:hypothetical protein n=1 Tax=Gilliamella sp. wkB112 TaxID=3120257 RepID=UPI00080DF062|nr:hypothetical protein [Gilliamella apicola]OCG01236.1 hypothetical protein A9G12_01380 [Gilliamella apicola]